MDGSRRVEETVDHPEGYRLIDETASRCWRRDLSDLVLPALPPIAALALAASIGVLPLEIAVAAAIALGFLVLYATGMAPSRAYAARFLDGATGAKDHFLTLATVGPDRPLMTLVAGEAAAIARRAPAPSLPPRRKKPLVTSFALSLAGLLALWSIPQMPSLAAGGSDLDHLAAELAASGDADLAKEIREVAQALQDPKRSNEDKRKKIDEAIKRIEEAERKAAKAGSKGTSSGGGKEGDKGEKQSGGQRAGGSGSGEQRSSTAQEQKGGQGSGSGNARERAKQQLSELAGQLSGEAKETKSGEGKEGKKTQPSGGEIQGPESGKDRKPGDRDVSGNQPGKSPEQSGGNEKPGGNQGEAKSEKGAERSPQGAGPSPSRGSSGAGEGAGQKPSSQADGKPAERYYKPGEGPGGGIQDGQYVRVRVPEESRILPGTETVAKPGDVLPEVPYGNAPLPAAGPAGEVGTDQPVPLEYRDALRER
jgi:hypothetical protein